MDDDKFGLRITILIIIVVIIGGLYIMKKNTNTDKQVDIGLSVPQAISESQPVSTSPDDSNTAVVTELLAEDIVVGSGAEATSGATISVHYTGRLLNGTKFDSSLDRGAPFSFTLGVGQVIPGWDQGVQGMKVGGTRKLTIPSDLAYGETGQGPIPPNSPLLFEVELLAVE